MHKAQARFDSTDGDFNPIHRCPMTKQTQPGIWTIHVE